MLLNSKPQIYEIFLGIFFKTRNKGMNPEKTKIWEIL